ncbi:PDR/VanB family oxidoreductase [Saccharopolyspora mangrovi]|uniref:PDR/VanB family oxidoreductase n=1 Tax=Saccharopolyspora mangrovi TaxID=3082379 RepID=A0ABU6AEQ3_9PSEU|nr:PDR/VanB family oxidoreductase [Saccharopolyspora sp. S2-29]MEB3370028.1 PDR/VanB family oxidoreductase [Saccharopolyspora sp. S2-29]
MDTGTPVTPPPDLYGRPGSDSFMQRLAAFSDNAVTSLAQRSVSPKRPSATGKPAIRELVVVTKHHEAEDVVSLRLAASGGGEQLPPWQPGAHIELHLPSGRKRQYSLCGDPADRYAYRIAVRRIANGGGGSTEVHDALQEGTRVTIAGPRNAFPFAADASVLLIAGGIGITPILPMAREATRRGLDWRLVHTGRSRGSMPFAAELAELAVAAPGRVSILPDDESGVPEAAEMLSLSPAEGAVYCCGPAPMIDGVRQAFGESRASALHFERFAPPPIMDGRPFELQLGDTGRVLPVPADRSALDVLHEARPDMPFSCRQGFCGTCRVQVSHGQVDHRDRQLTDAERAAGAMLPCVSRAPEGERLVLEM